MFRILDYCISDPLCISSSIQVKFKLPGIWKTNQQTSSIQVLGLRFTKLYYSKHLVIGPSVSEPSIYQTFSSPLSELSTLSHDHLFTEQKGH